MADISIESMKKVTRCLLVLLLCLSAVVPLGAQTEGYGAALLTENGLSGTNTERYYEMHSVMKFPQALYVAAWLERKGIGLETEVTVSRQELMQDTWSPMLKTMGDTRTLTYGELLAFSLQQSDNNACDLLFRLCGGPRKVERYLRRLGLKDIRIRKTERQMHERPSVCCENRCTPAAMVRLLAWFSLHKDDTPALRRVWQLMAECRTGEKRIPAALPPGAALVHKTGTGFGDGQGRCPMNDVGIVLLPDGRSLSIAVFVERATDESQMAEVARELME